MAESSNITPESPADGTNPKRKRASRYTEPEWQAIEGRLFQLYFDENKSLKDTQKILHGEGFVATESQLNNRIKKSSQNKYTSRARVMTQIRQRRLEYLSPIDESLDPQMQRYARRNQLQLLVPLGRTMGQQLLHDVREYVMHSFGQNNWLLMSDESIVHSSRTLDIDKSALHSFLSNLELGCKRSLGNDREITLESALYFDIAFRDAKQLVHGTYHDHLPNLIRQLTDLYKNGFGRTATDLQRRISAYARACGAEHRLQREIFGRLHAVTPEQVVGLEEAIQTLFQNLFEQRFGSHCYGTFVMVKDNARRRLEQNPQAPFDKYLPNLAELDRQFGPSTRRSMDIVWLRADIYFARGELDAAAEEVSELLRRADNCHDTWLHLYYQTGGSFLLGCVRIAQQENAEATEVLEKFLVVEAQFSGQLNGYIFRANRVQACALLVQLAMDAGHSNAVAQWQSELDDENMLLEAIGSWTNV